MDAKVIIDMIVTLESRKQSLAHKALAETDEAKQERYNSWWASADEEIKALENQLAEILQ